MKRILHLTFFVVLVSIGFADHAKADDPIYTSTFSNKAVKGYDVISYFTDDGVPVKGDEAYTTQWRGADWYFASQQNLDAFKAEPEKYAPQYGGYCAWAIAHGTLAKGDLLVYHLEDGKLYLNYDESINEGWLPRRGELIPKGDEKYPDLVEIQ